MFQRLILIVARERYLALGLEPVSSTPEEMAAAMRREQERYATIIRNANIKIEQ
jgi:tripartite-type tricarboxylate transporter receptor subunit TctC